MEACRSSARQTRPPKYVKMHNLLHAVAALTKIHYAATDGLENFVAFNFSSI